MGDLPEDAGALFYPTVTRSAADPDEISAGAGIGYFSLVWNIGQGLNRGIVGGPVHPDPGDRRRPGRAACSSRPRSWRSSTPSARSSSGTGRTAWTTRSRRGASCWRRRRRRATGSPWTSPPTSATRSARSSTARTSARRSSPRKPPRSRGTPRTASPRPKRSFNIVLNQSSLVRGGETARQPGSSIMAFSPAGLASALLPKTDEEILRTYTDDLNQVLGKGFGDIGRRGAGPALGDRRSVLLPGARRAPADPDAARQPCPAGRRLPRDPLHRDGRSRPASRPRRRPRACSPPNASNARPAALPLAAS